jgi:hypothetical protein
MKLLKYKAKYKLFHQVGVIFISTFNSFDTRKHSVTFKQWFICEHQSHPHAKPELSLFFSVLESLPAFPRLSSSLVLGFSDSDAVIRRLVPNLLTRPFLTYERPRSGLWTDASALPALNKTMNH